jgi:RNA-directed DNA polymerase
MKRMGNIIPRVAEYGNFMGAFYKAAKGKRSSPEVRSFTRDLSANVSSLVRETLSGDVAVGRFHCFVIRDPKQRVIHAASFRERVLHHAIMNVTGEWFERGAIEHSYACRRGKGNRAALSHALKQTTTTRCFLKLDIRRYFDSIDHEVLRQRLRRLFKDDRFLQLLDRIVGAFETAPGCGLPIGTLTSQYFANTYLDPLDRFVIERLKCRRYARFMDDFILWSDDAGALMSWRDELSAWLSATLKLSLKEHPLPGRSSDGLPFLGYRLKPGRVLLSRPSRQRFLRRLNDYEAAFAEGLLDEQGLQRRVDALLSFTSHAPCVSWRRTALASRKVDSVLE